MSDRIALDVSDGVAVVRMTRADKMNALDEAMFDELLRVGEQLSVMSSIRAVVLHGQGRAFCAGLDLSNFERMKAGPGHLELVARTHGLANVAQQIVLQWRQLAVPVIAAVHGVALGGGFQLALGADMRFVHPETRFSVMEIRWGLVPDMAGILLMRELMRPDVVSELTYSGRVFTATEAQTYGLVTRLCDEPLEAALSFAKEIAARSPSAIRAAKRLLSIADDSEPRRILQAESCEQAALMGSAEQVEAVRATQSAARGSVR
ncbi:MAG: Enoyl-CoA hydratase/isomerase [Hydrocarboniphaga sp.]|uniref:crotonase/enoyl-CoA hydratase family protein n=1 Tax=Hydrocarboniphaga sp. TaxID=2033016 RepID=UPI0026187675|nr:crotonase/enoyl-CoA hydratase family protein [Hydrocarboniphaga sp.]MDB5969936.1 Enoyl-CoA hydratase/isomerase [Hydrocarboniphaga sp.]